MDNILEEKGKDEEGEGKREDLCVYIEHFQC